MDDSNLTTGEIKEVFRDGVTTKFKWPVPNYFTNTKSIYSSHNVEYFNSIWRLEIRIFGNLHNVYLTRIPRKNRFSGYVRFTVGYKKADGTEEDIARNSVFPHDVEYFYWKQTFLCQKSSSTELTITCTIWDDHSSYQEVLSRVTEREGATCTGARINDHPLKGVSRATQTGDASCTNSRINEDPSKDFSILLEHLKNLRLSGDDHDFLMKVKDKEFRAHKCVLRARSPVFAAMFRSQMTESADDSVTIDDCDPDAFGQFLSYVYTGKVTISSASQALGVYYSGDKYDFPRVKEMSVDFLKNSLTAAKISDVINMAVRHGEGELLQQALVYLATNLQDVMVTVEWQRFLMANPIQANEMCIKALQCVKRD